MSDKLDRRTMLTGAAFASVLALPVGANAGSRGTIGWGRTGSNLCGHRSTPKGVPRLGAKDPMRTLIALAISRKKR